MFFKSTPKTEGPLRKQLKGFAYLKVHDPEKLKQIVTKGGQTSRRGKVGAKNDQPSS